MKRWFRPVLLATFLLTLFLSGVPRLPTEFTVAVSEGGLPVLGATVTFYGVAENGAPLGAVAKMQTDTNGVATILDGRIAQFVVNGPGRTTGVSRARTGPRHGVSRTEVDLRGRGVLTRAHRLALRIIASEDTHPVPAHVEVFHLDTGEFGESLVIDGSNPAHVDADGPVHLVVVPTDPAYLPCNRLFVDPSRGSLTIRAETARTARVTVRDDRGRPHQPVLRVSVMTDRFLPLGITRVASGEPSVVSVPVTGAYALVVDDGVSGEFLGEARFFSSEAPSDEVVITIPEETEPGLLDLSKPGLRQSVWSAERLGADLSGWIRDPGGEPAAVVHVGLAFEGEHVGEGMTDVDGRLSVFALSDRVLPGSLLEVTLTPGWSQPLSRGRVRAVVREQSGRRVLEPQRLEAAQFGRASVAHLVEGRSYIGARFECRSADGTDPFVYDHGLVQADGTLVTKFPSVPFVIDVFGPDDVRLASERYDTTLPVSADDVADLGEIPAVGR